MDKDKYAEIHGAAKQQEKKTKSTRQSPPIFTDKKASSTAKVKSVLGKHEPIQIKEEPTPAAQHKPADPRKAIPNKKGSALASVQKLSFTLPPKPTPKIRLPTNNEKTNPIADFEQRVKHLINRFAKRSIKKRSKYYKVLKNSTLDALEEHQDLNGQTFNQFGLSIVDTFTGQGA